MSTPSPSPTLTERASTFVTECRACIRDCILECEYIEDDVTTEYMREHASDCDMGCWSALESADIVDALLTHVAELERQRDEARKGLDEIACCVKDPYVAAYELVSIAVAALAASGGSGTPATTEDD